MPIILLNFTVCFTVNVSGQIAKASGTNARTGGTFVPLVTQLKYALVCRPLVCRPDGLSAEMIGDKTKATEPTDTEFGADVTQIGWRLVVAVTRWSRSTQLLYIEPG